MGFARGFALAFLMFTASAARADGVLITGAGATFPYPIYSKWFAEYNRAHTEARFNYQSIGSGAGIKQILERTIDFGATDTPMTEAELAKGPGIVHVPTVIGAIAVVYQGQPDGLRLDGIVLADIFTGRIKRWNDARLQQLNPGVALADRAIVVVHRSDGSGTTAVFTDYLAKVSAPWKSGIGAAKTVRWPVGVGAKGNEGVTAMVKSIPGAIGYVELAYARQNHLYAAQLRNREGNFVAPTADSASAAAVGSSLPTDLRGAITDPAGANAYPIAALTYVLVHRDQNDSAKALSLARFLWWALHDGQTFAAGLDYAPLPSALLPRAEALVRSLTIKGKSVLASQQ